MATISKHLFLRHLRAEPNQFVLHFNAGKLSKSGPGLAYWFLPLSAALAQVPVEDCSTTFVLNERSADFQAVKLQCTIVYRINDPAKAASRFNFSISIDTGLWLERPLDTLASLWMQRALPAARNFVAKATLEQALRTGSDEIRAVLWRTLSADAEMAAMGLQLVSVVLDQIAPSADVEKALQTPTREAIQSKADEATFQRRALAVEKERAIKENELATELELERKQTQLIQQRGDNALAQVRQDAQVEKERDIAAQERFQLASEGAARRSKIDALAQADAERLMAATRTEELNAQHQVWRETPAAAAMGVVMARFAENVHSIGHLNITPDMLVQNLQSWLSQAQVSGPSAKPEAVQPSDPR